MSQNSNKDLAIVQLIPNMLTIVAICAGLSSIRFAVHGNFELAVQLIFVAGVLDFLDGRLARLIGSESDMGAELDSLADFLNFGVAPALILYFWALQDMRGAAWIAVLIYTICCVLRLARFNVTSRAETEETGICEYFYGLPSPAAALLVMFPLYLSFSFADRPLLHDWVICAVLILVGISMISRIPIWSFKTTRISRKNAKFVLIVGVALGASVLTFAWTTLVAVCLLYLAVIIWSLIVKSPKPAQMGEDDGA